MLKSATLLAILAFMFSIVCSDTVDDPKTIISSSAQAASAASAVGDGGNGTAAAVASAASASSTVIKSDGHNGDHDNEPPKGTKASSHIPDGMSKPDITIEKSEMKVSQTYIFNKKTGMDNTDKSSTDKTKEETTESECIAEWDHYTGTIQFETTTQEGSNTIGPNDCNGRHQRYYRCGLSCPQRSCSEYLNGVKCSADDDESRKCLPECRCQPGHYWDFKGNCVNVRECRRLARVPSPTSKPNYESNNSSTSNPPVPDCMDVATKSFIQGNLAYTATIMNELVQSNTGNNVMCSGVSILYLMAELLWYAKGDTKKELMQALNFKDTDQMCSCSQQSHLDYLLMTMFRENILLEEMKCFFPQLHANISAENPNIEFNLIAKIYADEECELTDDFKTTTKNTFFYEAENLDFTSSESAEDISNTIAQATHNRIRNYIKPSTLSSLYCLIMVDAQTFKGAWEKPFDPRDTSDSDFYFSGKTVKKPTMYKKGLFFYAECRQLGARAVKMLYQGGEFSLVIFLPNSRDGLRDHTRRLMNTDMVTSCLNSMKLEDVEIHVPRFTITVANKLKNPTKKANVTRIFNNETSGLEDIVSSDTPYVSEILQKLMFEVNELGVGDSQETDFQEFEGYSPPSRNQRSYVFKVDHPFSFCLFYKDFIIFSGTYVR